MKMRMIIPALCVVSLMSMNACFSHPPSKIDASFDGTTKMLKAVIYHDVKDVKKHFIKKVDVSLNGKEIVTQQISRQDNKDTQTVLYLIPDADPDASIEVEAYCSIAGKLSVKAAR